MKYPVRHQQVRSGSSLSRRPSVGVKRPRRHVSGLRPALSALTRPRFLPLPVLKQAYPASVSSKGDSYITCHTISPCEEYGGVRWKEGLRRKRTRKRIVGYSGHHERDAYFGNLGLKAQPCRAEEAERNTSKTQPGESAGAALGGCRVLTGRSP